MMRRFQGLLAVGLVLGGLPACQTGVGEGPARPAAAVHAPPSAAAAPAEPPPGVEVPEGMVYVPGGEVRIGAEDGDPFAKPHEYPAFETVVEPYLLDRSPVTVRRFRRFVEAAGYETRAEAFGDAAVFDAEAGAWTLRAGASWHHPLGPDAAPAAEDHPVTQVAWSDASAFCEWEGKRLPSEVEWEYAARGGTSRGAPYAWGDRLADAQEHGGLEYHANTWTGTFPHENTAADGYRLTSPVGTFGETPLGLTDLGGNVWEWTADWYRAYAARDQPFTPDAESEKAMRGGSFMCHADYCHGYRVSARSHATPETSLFHVGFRCAAGLPPPPAG